MDSYGLFLRQLDKFLRRYYLNKAFKGFIVWLALVPAGALVLGVVQLAAFASAALRAGMFYGTLAVLAAVLGVAVVWPLLQSGGRAARMSYMQAARYLSMCYPELGDRLYNALELKRSTEGSVALLEAAVEQITSGFAAYRFEKAVRWRRLLPYGYGFAGVTAVVVLVFLFEPRVMRSTAQVIRYTENFEREFPFQVTVLNSSFKVGYEEDFTLRVEVAGERLPDKIFLSVNDRLLPLNKVSANDFTYTFRKVRQNEVFYLKTGKYTGGPYTLEVEYKPLLSGMKALLKYPAYMQRKTEAVTNTLDLQVPYGTRIEWELKIDHARSLQVWTKGDDSAACAVLPVDTFSRPLFRFSTRALADFHYSLIPLAYYHLKADSLTFGVKVIPDAYPRIQVQGYRDSLNLLQSYYQGFISDDYGFHALVFAVRCTNPRIGNRWERFDTLEIDALKNEQTFTYFLDLAQYAPESGDELSYGFSVSDNDPFYPYKTVYSPMESYRKMSLEEVREELGKTSAGIEQSFSLSLQTGRDFEKELEKLVQDLISKQQFSWEDRQKVEVLIEQQRQLRQQYERLNEELLHKRELETEAGLEDPDLLEKQRELQELLSKLLDDKTLEKLQQLQQLMEKQAGQDKLMDKLEELKFNEEQMQKELEQNMNLFRQMEFEMRMDEAIRSARDLVKEGEKLQDALKKLTDKSLDKIGDSLRAENEALKQGVEKLGRDMEDLKALDEKLEKPNGFKMPDSLLQKLEKSMQQTSDALERKNSREAREKHGQTQQNLEDLADNLQQQMQDIEAENAAEDADFIRLLLKSVLRVSLEQEDLMTGLEKMKVNDPRYSGYIRRQSALNMEINFVVDSVRAIARRQPKVAVGTREILRTLQQNSRESLEYLLGMNNVYYQRYSVTNSWALTRQQYAMTALNDLALMLSESLDHMQENMQMKGSASKSSKKKKGQPQMSCPTPGQKGQKDQQNSTKFPSLQQMQKGNKDSKSLQQMQKALNEQIEALKKMLEEKARQQAEAAQKQGSSQQKNGQTGSSGGERISDEDLSEGFARAAAEQEKIRRMLQEKMAKEKNGATQGLYNSVLGDMERTEKDLVNKILNGGLLERQKKIETRMLEAENAELKRERDEKRESKQGRVFTVPAVDSLAKDKVRDVRTRELLLRQTPDLRPFYREQLNKYLFKE